MGWGDGPRSRLAGSRWPRGPRYVGRGSRAARLGLSVPESHRTAVSSWGRTPHSPQRSGALSCPGRRGSVGDPPGEAGGLRECRGAVAGGGEAGLPGWGAALVRNPLESTVRGVSACTLLCQGMAAGVERRGPVIVYGLWSASYTRGAAPTGSARCSAVLRLLAGHANVRVSVGPPKFRGLPLLAVGKGRVPQ